MARAASCSAIIFSAWTFTALASCCAWEVAMAMSRWALALAIWAFLRICSTLSIPMFSMADAMKYKAEKEAEAQLISRQRDADAKAYEAIKEAEARKAEAEALRFAMEQEAEGIRAKGLAEAEAIEKKAEAQKKMGEASVLEMYLNALPDVVKNAAAPLAQTDKIVMYGDGNSTKLVKDVMSSASQVMDGVKESTGLDLAALLAGVVGGRMAAQPVTVEVTPVPAPRRSPATSARSLRLRRSTRTALTALPSSWPMASSLSATWKPAGSASTAAMSSPANRPPPSAPSVPTIRDISSAWSCPPTGNSFGRER